MSPLDPGTSEYALHCDASVANEVLVVEGHAVRWPTGGGWHGRRILVAISIRIQAGILFHFQCPCFDVSSFSLSFDNKAMLRQPTDLEKQIVLPLNFLRKWSWSK